MNTRRPLHRLCILTALLLSCSLGLGAGELRLKHRISAATPDEAEALLATHLQALTKSQFDEDCRNHLVKLGAPPELTAPRLAGVTILYEPQSGDLLLRSTDEKALNAVADAVIRTGISLYLDAVLDPIEAAEAKGDHALAERLRNETYPGPANIHWWVDRSAEPAKPAASGGCSCLQPATTQAAQLTAVATARTPAAAQDSVGRTPDAAQQSADRPAATEPEASAFAAIEAEPKTAPPSPLMPPATRDTLLLKHYTDPDQLAIPQLVATTLARQIAALGSEWFRQESIEALVQQGLSTEDAAKAFDAITIRYNLKTRDLYLSGADEPALRTIGRSLLSSSIRTGIDVFMTIAEDVRLRGDTAFLEKHGIGTRTGGHASLWRIVGMVKSDVSEVHETSRTKAEAIRQSRWEPPLSTAHLPTQQAIEADITTDYKTYAPGIMIPPGAERAITRDRNVTITTIFSADYYPSYNPHMPEEEQARKYEYLLVSLSLGTPEGVFESMWHGALVLRKPIADNHWDNAEAFTPLDAFSKKMASYLSDEQIEALLHTHD